jgi:sugar phosphate isomerase/epimerase
MHEVDAGRKAGGGMTTTTSSMIRMGSTTYSFNDEYHSYECSLEGLFEKIGELGPKQGIELIGPQCIRTFPEVSEEFERIFKRSVERYNLVPSAFGHYSDMSRITGRDLTQDEMLEYSRMQLEGAKRLGFTLARLSYFSFDVEDRSKTLYRLLLPDAERLGIRLAIEIHCPHIIESAGQQRVIEDILKLNSPYVGFTLDCGTMTARMSPVCIQKFLDLGLSSKIVNRIVEMWTQRFSRAEIEAEVQAMGGGELGQLLAIESQIYFGHGEPAAMLDIMPVLFHVHGKFYNVDKSGNDDTVRYPEIIDTLVRGGYKGWISSEYEGHHWLKDRNAFGQVKAHQQLLMRLISESEARFK